jgi:hypothetical protein
MHSIGQKPDRRRTGNGVYSFVVYLTTLSEAQTKKRRTEELEVICELEAIWKEAVVA